jgi:hypothetical protein
MIDIMACWCAIDQHYVPGHSFAPPYIALCSTQVNVFTLLFELEVSL